MYKILYLPFGEDLLVCIETEAFKELVCPYIKKGTDPQESPVGLRMPGYRPNHVLYKRFTTAIFEDIETAKFWINELINRPDVKKSGNFRKEYFELIVV